MVKKRGLATNRGLDALLGSIKKETLIANTLADTSVVPDASAPDTCVSDISAPVEKTTSIKKVKPISPQSVLPQPIAQINQLVENDKTATDLDGFNLDGLNLLHIDVGRLQRGKYQPRINLGEDALQELATSIKQHGVMQPIVIRPLAIPNQQITHEIIAGERRWRAAQIAGLSQIPAILRPISDDLAIALALIENIQREDLTVMEQAVALQRFHDEFGMSHAQIADVVGKARATVSNLLRLNQLHDDVKQALNQGYIDMGHARALLSLSAPQQPLIAKRIVQEQLTVRQTETLVKDILDPKQTDKPSKEIDYDRLRLNQQLSEQLGALVKIKGSSTGKGSIEIFFHSEDELTTLIEQLQGRLDE
ncbi:chromosome segregation DNA-binding protein [Moraxella macacae 0408225]|uniref:Probable chromosome-partitioning protein ParB n=1 Tax=Moraxella macacae 0408225 TaxID=1230338 RepID=L2F560_9GAMM|nr:ParB/RepB/Spo0J family partition protein [Moraxella macacae]ELA08152.1 chromosome segregation DNA-binding protein [Moraxella macacae 0408225]